MSTLGIFKRNYIVGLDLGASSVKIAQFVKKEDGLHLVKAGLKEIKRTDDDAFRDNETIQVLKELTASINLKKSKVIASINCPKTAVKIANVPRMPKAELREGIKLEAKTYFPFPIDNSLMDFEILGDVVEKGARKYEIAISVSPKETVNKYLSLLGKAGIKPASFVPCPYAMQRASQRLSIDEKKPYCIVDMGERHTEFIIFKGGGIEFSRKIPISGFDITKAMTGLLVSDRGKTELTLDEAEKIKREVGIPPEGETKIIDDKISSIQILSMIRTPLEQMASEIERCFDYYREESGGEKIDSLVLFGGGAGLGGLIKFLSESLGIGVRLGDPLEGLNIKEGAVEDVNRVSYLLAQAIGAALSGGKGINLLPPEIKDETKAIFTRGTIEVIGTAAVLIAAFFYIGMKIQLGNFEKRISAAGMELASLQPQFKKAEAHHLANMVLVDEPHWEDVFKELSNIIPDKIRLTNLRLEDNVITMKGIVDSADGEELMSDFILTLGKGIFTGVTLVQIRDLTGAAGNEFELKCRVD